LAVKSVNLPPFTLATVKSRLVQPEPMILPHSCFLFIPRAVIGYELGIHKSVCTVNVRNT